ncbi:MAG TPA: flagellar biosynthesis anti-sigma factor FlgM [Bryobacteraceae bacterium]|nr:flagellar biosynthesis anti-sigma factor FlgM [Bryobacteraceae bacterium]
MTIDDRASSVGSNSTAERLTATTRNQNSSSKAALAADSTVDDADGADMPRFAALVSATVNGAQERADRVEQLRQLVATGRYQVDSQALSRSIVDSTLKGY